MRQMHFETKSSSVSLSYKRLLSWLQLLVLHNKDGAFPVSNILNNVSIANEIFSFFILS